MRKKIQFKRFLLILPAVIILGCLAGQVPAVAEQKVLKMMETPGTVVAATPISIPRPIRLVRMNQPQPPANQTQTQALIKNMAVISAPRITDCYLKSLNGKEMILSLSYDVPGSLADPVFCGAFMYKARQQAVNVGYKPLQLTRLPNGSADLTMVLPETAFTSSYIETFLMRSGKIVTRAQFKMPFEWNGATGKLLMAAKPGAGPDESISSGPELSFCEKYARAAVAQYELGIEHRLPGIVAPAWSNNQRGHYDWCTKVPADFAVNEDRLRQEHLKKHLPSNPDKPFGCGVIPGLNPGRGP